jgi:hypothetical protein
MALQYSPKIVQDGLVLCLDASQNKSFPVTDLPVKSGLIMWMDASDDTTFSYSSGTTVSQWRDKSGLNYHMVPVSAGPTRNSTLNSRKTLSFTTSQDIQNLVIDLRTSAYSIFVVDRYTNASSGTGRILTSNSGNNNWLLGHWASETNKYYANGWVYSVYAAIDTNWKLYLGDWGGPSNDLANFYGAGTAIATNSADASAGPWTLGINANSGERSNCETAEIIVFNRLLTTTERKLVHTYLGQKWGILNSDRTAFDLTNTLTAGLTVGADLKFQRSFNGAFFINPITGTIDSGVRYGTSTDKVVDSANSWTVTTTIEKAGNTINNWWHLFTDGNSGDILTLDTDGTFKTSMNNSGGNGTFTTGTDIGNYGFTWSNLSDGTHELTLVYDRPNTRLQLYIDGIGGGWQTGRVINSGYYLRNFHGWGSAEANYHSDLTWSSLKVYNRLLTDTEILQNYNATRSRNAIGSYSNPASSAVSIKTAIPSAKSGWYYIKPDGYTGTPVLTFCDLETDTGGWMHVGTIYDNNEAYDNSTNHPWGAPLNPFQSTGIWEDFNTLNTTAGTPFTTDYKNNLWTYAPLSQIMIKYNGASQNNILYTNTGQLQCSSLSSFFAGLNWMANGSDTSLAAYSASRVKTLDITNNGITDPVLGSGTKTKLLFKFGEYDGTQDANKDRTMIAGHRYDASDNVDTPWGLGCFTNLNGTIHYRDIVPTAQNSNDYPPNSITGAPHAFSIWVKETPNFLGSYNNPATSGKAIKDTYAYATTGWYWLRVDNSINLYWIDMDYDGGGWVLVANNRLNTGNIGTTVGTYAASTTGFITKDNYGLGTNPKDFNLWVGLSKWNSIAAASGQRKFVYFVSSNIGCKLGLTAFHTKRAKWTWTGWNGTYVWQGVGNYSLELGSGNPGLYAYHISSGLNFTAYDLDQDTHPGNCATFYGNTPFWYGNCWDGNFWGGGSGGSGYADGPFWAGASTDYHNYGAYYVK